MAPTLATSENELRQIDSVLDKRVPSFRQPYSDRMAWMMACLSELAYIKFNPLFKNDQIKEYFLENIAKLADENKKSSLLKLIDLVGYDPQEEQKALEEELGTLRMRLVATFDRDGTQAILVSNNRILGLAFRGTEATSLKDIKADAKANITKCDTPGNIHAGFKEAFKKVELLIQNKLNEDEFQNMPLFITGHSLGGALATIAAKKLSHKGGIAACYTFGAPRVGDDEWITNIETPIYRLVNAADCVTMLPPGTETITVMSFLSQFIPWVGPKINSLLLSTFGGYIHAGNMRYLTNCRSGQYDDVKLLYSVSIFFRIKGLLMNKLPWKKFLADHSINVYRKKLAVVAQNRNN